MEVSIHEIDALIEKAWKSCMSDLGNECPPVMVTESPDLPQTEPHPVLPWTEPRPVLPWTKPRPVRFVSRKERLRQKQRDKAVLRRKERLQKPRSVVLVPWKEPRSVVLVPWKEPRSVVLVPRKEPRSVVLVPWKERLKRRFWRQPKRLVSL